MAQDHTLVITPTIETINTLELNNVFDTTQLDQLQALELSKQEMKETEGAMLPLALLYPMLGGALLGVGINTGIVFIPQISFQHGKVKPFQQVVAQLVERIQMYC